MSAPIFDEAFAEEFNRIMIVQGRRIKTSFEEAMKAFDGWDRHIRQWQEAFNNQYPWGAEFVPSDVRQREAERMRRKKQDENCLKGKTKFKIRWDVPLKCPRCFSRSVFISTETIMCLLCGWKKWRRKGEKQ